MRAAASGRSGIWCACAAGRQIIILCTARLRPADATAAAAAVGSFIKRAVEPPTSEAVDSCQGLGQIPIYRINRFE